MNKEEIKLISDSYEKLKEKDYIDLFYNIFFEINPKARAMFNNDLTSQKIKIEHTIYMFIKGLNKPHELESVLFNLGSRHIEYGVQKAEFDDIEKAMLQTILSILPDASEDTINSWRKALHFACDTMKSAWNT